MACTVSWLPHAVAVTLREEPRCAPLVAWLHSLRDTTEEYDPLVTVRSDSPSQEHSEPSASPDSAFDEILSQLGKEIYKLDEYQRILVPQEDDISPSILNLFDECLGDFPDESKKCDSVSTVHVRVITDKEAHEISASVQTGVTEDCSERDSINTLCDGSFATSTPVKPPVVRARSKMIGEGRRTPPIPPPRTSRLAKTPSSSSSFYDTMEVHRETPTRVESKENDSDSESTCWSYKECSDDDAEAPKKDDYSVVWVHSSGYHNSDEILRRILSHNKATVSRIKFDTASEFTPQEYAVYSMHQTEVGDRWVDSKQLGPQSCRAMTPDRPSEDGYEPVRDAITAPENIYEEIEYGYSYTDEGCSCNGSVEVESCSISASSEGMGRESPLYANLRDHGAYEVPPDVLAWKNSLLDPFFIEDEEDEWITPEECAVYSREQRPPLVIPRITQYRGQRDPCLPSFQQQLQDQFDAKGLKPCEHYQDSSPTSEGYDLDQYSEASSESPRALRPLTRNRRVGSTETLLFHRPIYQQSHVAASSSGDSLDVEVRGGEGAAVRRRKSRSMVAPKPRLKSPVPAPRLLLPRNEAGLAQPKVVHEGPVRRTKFAENGKKCKKNWSDCYVILTTTALTFYKDHRSYLASTQKMKKPGAPPSPTSYGAELVLSLNKAFVHQCMQMHTRRHTRSLVVILGNDHYLLQDETEERARRWLYLIQHIIYKCTPVAEFEHIPPELESPGMTPLARRLYKEKESKAVKQKAGGSSNEDSDSAEASLPKRQIKSRLMKFFAKRPSMEHLVETGIYKDEPVFGRKLDQVCPPTSPRVPEFVVACVTEIEKSEENMCTDGLYRASGNLSQVQKIRLEIDQKNRSVIENSPDIHVLTGSLKLFFRELKEPLIPCTMFDRILSACSIKPREARTKEFREIVNALPPCNRDTLKYLLEHLIRVTKYSERNRMHTANLAIVFGPTLLWAPPAQAHNIAVDCIQQNNVVDILLTDFKDIFSEDGGKTKEKA